VGTPATGTVIRTPQLTVALAGALSCYASGPFLLAAGELLSAATPRPFVLPLALVGATFLGSAVLVAWAARTDRSTPQGL